MISGALPLTVTAAPEDRDRLAEFCGDLPLALDITLRKIAVRPHLVLSRVLDDWQQNGHALSWLRVGDLSVREALRSAYQTLSRPAQVLLHWLARTAAEEVGPLPSEEDELVDELIDAGILTHAGRVFAGLHLSPLVRAFVLDVAESTARGLPATAKPAVHRPPQNLRRPVP